MAIDVAMSKRVPWTRCLQVGLVAWAASNASCKHAKVARSEGFEAGPSEALTAVNAPPPAAPGGRGQCPGTEPPRNRTYYVCDCGPDSSPACRPGRDEVEGDRPDAPFRTYERARQQFGHLKPGEAIAFCRGGSFSIQPNSSQQWVNDACRATSPCVVTDYLPSWGKPDQRAPIIHAPAQSRVFSLDNGGPSRHEEGYVFANLELQGSGSGWAVFLYNDIDDVTMCNLVIKNFDIGVHLAGSDQVGPDSDGRNERIVLRNSRITDNPGQGWLGASSGSSIEDCFFENNGSGKAIYNHNIYLSGDHARHMRVARNQLHRSTIVEGKCQGTSLVVHGTFEDLRIEQNRIWEDRGAASPTCWGIGVVTGYDGPESFKNVVIDGNTIFDVGNVSIGLNACQDCLVQNNVIANDQGFNESAIEVPAIERGNGDALDERVVIQRNSIFVGGGTAITLEKEGTGHRVVNNAIDLAGRHQSRCFNLSLPSAAYAEVDYNVCRAGDDREWAKGCDLRAWTAQTGFDRHSAADDPGFVSTVSPGYNLQQKAKR